jgi:hypothetical protein
MAIQIKVKIYSISNAEKKRQKKISREVGRFFEISIEVIRTKLLQYLKIIY